MGKKFPGGVQVGSLPWLFLILRAIWVSAMVFG